MNYCALQINPEVEIFFLKIYAPFFEAYFYVTILAIEAISCVSLKQNLTCNISRATGLPRHHLFPGHIQVTKRRCTRCEVPARAR